MMKFVCYNIVEYLVHVYLILFLIGIGKYLFSIVFLSKRLEPIEIHGQ